MQKSKQLFISVVMALFFITVIFSFPTGVLAVLPAVTIHTTDFIPDESRTNFNGFEGISCSDWCAPIYIEDGIKVEQINGQGNDIWTTYTYWGAEGSHAWYPSGGDYGYTKITLVSGSDFSAMGLLVGSGWGGIGHASYLQYALLKDGNIVAQGEISTVNGSYLGFSGISFDTVLLSDSTSTGYTVFDGHFNALAIDSIEVGASSQPPTVPVLTNPENGHFFSGNRASLYWQKSTDPEGGNVTYRVQVAEDPGFTTNLQTFNVDGDGSLMESRIVVSAAAMLPFLALLGWRGRNRKKQTLMLLIAAMLLTTPLFISCSSKDGGVTYSYSNDDSEKDTSDGLGAGAIGLGGLLTGINNGDVDENTISFDVTGLSAGTTYYWRVIAVDDQNNTSEPSETRHFSTGLPLPI